MERLSHLLPKVLKQRGLHDEMVAGLVVKRAEEWIAAHLPVHVPTLHVKKFASGTVIIHADNPIALAECSLRLHELVRHLQATLTDAGIRTVRVVRG